MYKRSAYLSTSDDFDSRDTRRRKSRPLLALDPLDHSLRRTRRNHNALPHGTSLCRPIRCRRRCSRCPGFRLTRRIRSLGLPNSDGSFQLKNGHCSVVTLSSWRHDGISMRATQRLGNPPQSANGQHNIRLLRFRRPLARRRGCHSRRYAPVW